MELFVALTASLKRKHIKRWTAAVVAWEKDSTLEDPYMLISDGEGLIPHMTYCC